jgi:mannitol/fructose-specific phosphotransferase system IIA component (Ntr-type)
MHPLVNHLIQLQDLTLIRDEQKVTPTATSTGHTQQLDASIGGMTEELPPDIRNLFLKLHKKDHVVISPVSDGICAVCGMRLPISLVQAVRLGREIHSCPNCARMLYCTDTAVRRLGKVPRRTDPRKVGITRFSSETLMIPRLESDNKDGVIRELAYKMEHEGFVDKADKLVEEALRRETILSTAVDHGLAFPHVRGVEGGGLTLALGLSQKGINFGGDGENLTKIVFLIVIPTAASAFYLKLLAGLTETFMKMENRKALMAEKEADKLWKTLIKITRATIK